MGIKTRIELHDAMNNNNNHNGNNMITVAETRNNDVVETEF